MARINVGILPGVKPLGLLDRRLEQRALASQEAQKRADLEYRRQAASEEQRYRRSRDKIADERYAAEQERERADARRKEFGRIIAGALPMADAWERSKGDEQDKIGEQLKSYLSSNLKMDFGDAKFDGEDLMQLRNHIGEGIAAGYKPSETKYLQHDPTKDLYADGELVKPGVPKEKDERTTFQKDFDFATDLFGIQDSPEEQQKLWNVLKNKKGMKVFGPNGELIVDTGGDSTFTVGTQSEVGKKLVSFAEAKAAIQGTRGKIEKAPDWAFGEVGEFTETWRARLETLQGVVPGAGQIAEALRNQWADEMRSAAYMAEGRLLPILTGDQRFTEGDVSRARRAIAILGKGASKTRAMQAYTDIEELFDKVMAVGYEAHTTGTLNMEFLQNPDVSNEAKVMYAEDVARSLGIDVEALKDAQ